MGIKWKPGKAWTFLEEYVRKRHEKDRDFTFEREDLADGTVVYHVNTSGLLQRYTFTEI